MVAPVLNWKNLNIALGNLAKRIFNLERATGVGVGIGGVPAAPVNGGPLGLATGIDQRNFRDTASTAPVTPLSPFPIAPEPAVIPANLQQISIRLAAAPLILTAPTAGNFHYSEIFQSPSLGLWIGIYNGYENAGGSQTINFATGFAFRPHIINDASANLGQPAAVVTALSVILPGGMSAPVDGWLLLMGF